MQRYWHRCRLLFTALFACAPMALISPVARADSLDIIFNPIINSIDHSLAGVDAWCWQFGRSRYHVVTGHRGGGQPG
jgi:hypothetical protein